MLPSSSLNCDVDVKNRSVRIKNLPTGAQEGLLQQVLRKRALVKRVEVCAEAREAIAELENAIVRLHFRPRTSLSDDLFIGGGNTTSAFGSSRIPW